jgi:hypothetical protein
MNYAIQTDSGAMVYMYIKFRKDWFRQTKVVRVVYILHLYRQTAR